MQRMHFSRIPWGLLVCTGLTAYAAAADRIAKPVKDFSLKSHVGKEYSLHDFRDIEASRKALQRHPFPDRKSVV